MINKYLYEKGDKVLQLLLETYDIHVAVPFAASDQGLINIIRWLRHPR